MRKYHSGIPYLLAHIQPRDAVRRTAFEREKVQKRSMAAIKQNTNLHCLRSMPKKYIVILTENWPYVMIRHELYHELNYIIKSLHMINCQQRRLAHVKFHHQCDFTSTFKRSYKLENHEIVSL